MNSIQKSIVTCVLLTIPALSIAASRLLAEGPGYTITHTTAGNCGPTEEVAIESEGIALFADQSRDLQAALDAARAMIEFQCPRVDTITVTGDLRGLYEPVYNGKAMRGDDWLLVAERSISTASGLRENPVPEHTPRHYSVANLETGMQLEAAQRVVLETFGALPHYDAASRVMTLSMHGCPDDIDRAGLRIDPDWKCLNAWFSDGHRPVLERLELVQVIAGTDLTNAATALESHFGAADEREAQTGRSRWGKGGRSVDLHWTDDESSPVNSALSARLDRKGNNVVVHIKLQQAPSASGLADSSIPSFGLIL